MLLLCSIIDDISIIQKWYMIGGQTMCIDPPVSGTGTILADKMKMVLIAAVTVWIVHPADKLGQME